METSESTTRDRVRRVIEGVAVVLITGVTVTAASMWRTAELHDVDIASHHTRLSRHDTRIGTIESVGTVIHLAQATARLTKLEEAAETTVENAAAIEGIRATQTAQSAQLLRIEDAQVRQTDLIIRALERPVAQPPAAEPVSP